MYQIHYFDFELNILDIVIEEVQVQIQNKLKTYLLNVSSTCVAFIHYLLLFTIGKINKFPTF